MKNILLITILLMSACHNNKTVYLLDPIVEQEEFCLATSGEWRVYYVENPDDGWGEIHGRCFCPEGSELLNKMCVISEQ